MHGRASQLYKVGAKMLDNPLTRNEKKICTESQTLKQLLDSHLINRKANQNNTKKRMHLDTSMSYLQK